MIKNPVFKVGDVVVVIEGNYDSTIRWGLKFNNTGHLPLGCLGRIEARHGPQSWYIKRLDEQGKQIIDTFDWYITEREIHPADDEP